ncbi:MAG: hypothetical protein L0271_00880 [Gemmatimonadetes bacterium]|nr:hypothetical protein [Gemmatimonadota bacterium]
MQSTLTMGAAAPFLLIAIALAPTAHPDSLAHANECTALDRVRASTGQPAPRASAPCALRATARRQTADAWLAPDKFRHFFASYVAVSIGYAGALGAGFGHDTSLAIGVTAAGFAGLIKEWTDHRTGRGTSARDFAWNLLGIAGAVLLLR